MSDSDHPTESPLRSALAERLIETRFAEVKNRLLSLERWKSQHERDCVAELERWMKWAPSIDKTVERVLNEQGRLAAGQDEIMGILEEVKNSLQGHLDTNGTNGRSRK